ncbi:hypothetical protein E2F46_16870, partial [Luteimonas aestuarii]
MNRIYRKVWNKSLNQVVVASELATGDSAGSEVDIRPVGGRRLVLPAMLALVLGTVPPLALAQSVEVGGNYDCTIDTGAAEIAGGCVFDGSATASGEDAVAVGAFAEASGDFSTAVGAESVASGDASAAFGAGAIAGND